MQDEVWGRGKKKKKKKIPEFFFLNTNKKITPGGRSAFSVQDHDLYAIFKTSIQFHYKLVRQCYSCTIHIVLWKWVKSVKLETTAEVLKGSKSFKLCNVSGWIILINRQVICWFTTSDPVPWQISHASLWHSDGFLASWMSQTTALSCIDRLHCCIPNPSLLPGEARK